MRRLTITKSMLTQRNFPGTASSFAILRNPKNPHECLTVFHAKYQGRSIPGGKTDPGENLFEGLKRELQEEFGIQIIEEMSKCCYAEEVQTSDYGIVTQTVWDVTGFIGELTNVEPHKHSDLQWVPVKKIPYNGGTTVTLAYTMAVKAIKTGAIVE